MSTLPSPAAAITMACVSAVHGRGTRTSRSLAPTSLEVQPGESVAVIGRSGAGKSTLADIALGLRPPTTGTVAVGGEPWCAPGTRPPRHRRHRVQGIPQDPSTAFVPRWTLRRSIEQAVRRLTGDHDTEPRIRRAAELAQLDLALLDRRPAEVSGGQAQRAAITRALAAGPSVLVADEPTSALDPDTALAVSSALLTIAAEAGIALLLVTHDPSFARRCMRTITLTAPQGLP